MKRTYQKPQVLYEDFSLSGCITANCKVNPIASELVACTVNVDPNVNNGWYLFDTTKTTACNVQPPENVLCTYDVSGESYSLFHS